MGYYPIYVDMRRRRCLVIGGGVVAERKVASLVEAGAAVTVISPDITELIALWSKSGAIDFLARRYRTGDLAEFEIAFVATDDSEINAAVYEEGKNRGVWVNSADDPEHCDFILPSIIRRGDLAVAISTGGESPALARAVREELDEYFTADYARVVEIASEVRLELRARSLSASADAWNQALKGNFRCLIREGRLEEAKKILLETLETKLCA